MKSVEFSYPWLRTKYGIIFGILLQATLVVVLLEPFMAHWVGRALLIAGVVAVLLGVRELYGAVFLAPERFEIRDGVLHCFFASGKIVTLPVSEISAIIERPRGGITGYGFTIHIASDSTSQTIMLSKTLKGFAELVRSIKELNPTCRVVA